MAERIIFIKMISSHKSTGYAIQKFIYTYIFTHIQHAKEKEYVGLQMFIT